MPRTKPVTKVQPTIALASPWSGPESDADDGGITFSLLSRYLCCPERFRIKVIEGWGPPDDFNHLIEYGNLWHTCEEALARGPDPTNKKAAVWEKPLYAHAERLCRKYPLRQEQVVHWYNVCKRQFPVYAEYWAKHPDVKARRPLLQEHVFQVPYKLPSGRTVYLRGKWDSVDMIDGAIYLQENKTKGDVHELQMQQQLTFDLQTMMYVTALHYAETDPDDPIVVLNRDWKKLPVGGVRYNVVRRPLSGGKHSIVRWKGKGKKPEETHDHFYDRLEMLIRENAEFFFMRWRVEVHPPDVVKFRKTCLDPILENLCDDYKWWSTSREVISTNQYDYVTRERVYPEHTLRHYRRPYGIYNVLDEGGSTDLDEYLRTGSTVGLVKTDNLFPELTT